MKNAPATPYPTGTVTFLFTDIGGSTRLWETWPDAMRTALAMHDDILRSAVEERGGVVFKTVGDAVFAVFADPGAAMVAGIDGQRRLAAQTWPAPIDSIEVRMAIHTGVATETGGDYFGPTLNRVARLIALAYPGQVLVSRATAMLLRGALPADVHLRELGVFRLKDLSEPEPAAQLLAPGLRPDFPPLPSLDARPNNLPFEIARFIGREHELSEIQRQLGERRLITIVGPGGIGKTRLALQVAAETVERHPDGTWFADLSAVESETLIAQAVAVALRVREEPQRPLEDTLCDSIGAKSMAIVLDGVDRVLVGAATLAKTLLSRCPSLQIVATSRAPLHVTGERLVRIGALEEAADLFRDRAGEIDPNLIGALQNDDAVADICRRLDGIPLAIELAAAHVATLSTRELAARLSKSMKLLVSRDPTKDARHRTLRATISWSYDLLAPAEATAVCALSVFEGSFDIEAAAAVLAEDEDDALMLVDELTVKSMLATVGGSRPARYAMMATVREYLRDVTTDMALAQERKERYFQYFEHLVTGEQNAHAAAPLERLDADIVNIRAALAERIASKDSAAPKMAVALTPFWKARGFVTEGQGYLRQLLALPTLDDVTRAGLLRRAASFAIEKDDFDEARALNDESHRLYLAAADVNGVAETLFTLAVLDQRLDRGDLAAKTYRQAIENFRAAANAFGEALAIHNLALLAFTRSDFAEVESLIADAASALARASNETLDAHFAALRGRLALKRGEFDAAEIFYRQALLVQTRLGNRLEVGVINWELADVLVRQRKYADATAAARLCLSIGLEIEASALLIYGFEAFCGIALEEGRYEDAARHYGLTSKLRTSHYGHGEAGSMASIEQQLRANLGLRFDEILGQVRELDASLAAKQLSR